MLSDAVGIALLFCDHLVEEKNSSKKTLVGIFSVIFGQKFPLVFRPFWIYASLTNLVGEHPFAINIVSDVAKNVVFSAGGRMNVKGQDAVVELIIPVQLITFLEPGKYGVTLHVDGNTLLSRVLVIRESTETKI